MIQIEEPTWCRSWNQIISLKLEQKHRRLMLLFLGSSGTNGTEATDPLLCLPASTRAVLFSTDVIASESEAQTISVHDAWVLRGVVHFGVNWKRSWERQWRKSDVSCQNISHFYIYTGKLCKKDKDNPFGFIELHFFNSFSPKNGNGENQVRLVRESQIFRSTLESFAFQDKDNFFELIELFVHFLNSLPQVLCVLENTLFTKPKRGARTGEWSPLRDAS